MTYPTELTGQEIYGLYVHEPGSLVSNIAIAISCLTLLLVNRKNNSQTTKPWLLFFTCIGLGATGGIITHGFPTYIGELSYYLLWGIKNSFVALGNYFAAAAVLNIRMREKSRLNLIFQLKLVLIVALLFITYDFLPAVIDLAFTYMLVLVRCFSRDKPAGAGTLRWAFSVALVSGLLYLVPFNLANGWFTNKDAVHVFVIVSLVLISKSFDV